MQKTYEGQGDFHPNSDDFEDNGFMAMIITLGVFSLIVGGLYFWGFHNGQRSKQTHEYIRGFAEGVQSRVDYEHGK